MGKIWFKFSMSVSRVRVGISADWQPSLLLRTRGDSGSVRHGSWVTHGSNGSTYLDGSRGSLVNTCDPFIYDALTDD